MKSGENSAVVRSFAKVNLTLDVLGTRPDGYHAIESVMQTIGLHDTVSLTLSEGGGIRLSCDVPGIPTDERNLAYLAASLLFQSRGITRGLDIGIEKRIPTEAGLGGGSSNAAAVLRGLNRLLGLSMPDDEICELAAQVGSDVPFFLIGGIAFVSGRGERVRPLPDLPPMWMVIVKPPFGVSTAWSYRRLDEMRVAGQQLRVTGERKTASQRMVECMESGRLQSAVCGLQSNDLEAPAIEQHPEIGEIKAALIVSGAKAALMCGSGSAVFGLFDDRAGAEAAVSDLSDLSDGSDCVVTRTITREEALECGGLTPLWRLGESGVKPPHSKGTDTRLPAIILAGAPADPEMAAKYAIENRAELPIAGKTMIQHVVDALIASSRVGDIHVIGNIDCTGDVKLVEPRETLIDNLIAGAEACSDAERILVCTSDIPAVTTEAIDDFIDRCKETDVDFFYPLVTREDSERRFPGVKRTYARTAEGTFTGGNIMLFRRRFMLENGDTMCQAIQQRKSVVKLARLLGIGALARVILAQTIWRGAIHLGDLERVAGRILNARVKAVVTPHAEIAADVDRLEQAADIERCIAGL